MRTFRTRITATAISALAWGCGEPRPDLATGERLYDSGHTWHHPDEVLFGVTKFGLVPPYAPPGYQSDMPGFAGKLSDDEIRAVLAYIASHWSTEIRKLRAEMIPNARQR